MTQNGYSRAARAPTRRMVAIRSSLNMMSGVDTGLWM